MFVVIANWPQPRHAHWLALLHARAIENQAFVVAVNRCGRDPQHRYGGGSRIIDPKGNVLAGAGDNECVIQATIDLHELIEYRKHFPALRDMRSEFLSN